MTLPKTLRAKCPTHGLADFKWVMLGNWWVCQHWVGLDELPDGATAPQWRSHPDCCRAVVPVEWFTPDGGDVGIMRGGLVERVA